VETAEANRIKEITSWHVTNSQALTSIECVRTYGFVSDRNKAVHDNIPNAILSMKPAVYFCRPANMSCHNLCSTLKPPQGFEFLLGLGLKFCIQQQKPPDCLKTAIDRLRHSIRVKALMSVWDITANSSGTDSYIPSLYMKSATPLSPAPGYVEFRTEDFATNIQFLLQQNAHINTRLHSNLSRMQYTCMRSLKNDRRFIVCMTDKNLGPAIIERDRYIKYCLMDHLLKPCTYVQLSYEEAKSKLTDARRKLNHLLDFYRSYLTSAERTYFQRSLLNRVRIPVFYITLKVHKGPLASRPIVSCVGSLLNIFSTWLDYKMKALVKHVPTFLRDSNHTIEDLKLLGPLPDYARLFTADAVSMYTNIQCEEGCAAFQGWFDDYAEELPRNFPVALFMAVLKIVMTYNIFQFDNTYWLQLSGTAMGTSCACLYATIFWGYIERKRILPKWKHLLPFFKRFIDDKLGIWVGSTLEFEQFMIDLNSQGSLQWIASGLQSSVNFLDLTISFCQDNKLSFMTYQKAFNLYLYIPPSSAHPPGVLKSIIYGNLRRYWQQNTSIDDYIAIARQFADRLEARGHKRSTITELFLEATKAFTKTAPTKSTTAESPLYLHWEWHPRGLTRQQLRQAYNEHLQGHDGFDRLIIAYARPQNLRGSLTRSRLNEPPGQNASDFITTLNNSNA